MNEAQEHLNAYLQSNRLYIQEQLYNTFNIQCIEMKPLNQLDTFKMETTIKSIFDFGDNKTYKYFLSHLAQNIKQYIREQYSVKAIASYYVLDIQKLTDIVQYCIKHGFQAVESKPIPSPQPKSQIIKQKIVPVQHVSFIAEEPKAAEPKDEFKHVKPKVSTFLQKDKIPEKREFKIQKYTMPEMNVLPRYLISIPKNTVQKEQEQKTEVIPPLDNTYLIAHRKVMSERLQKLYQFYCMEQQNLGQGPTFDHIQNQIQKMNLGKFMQFCTYTKLFYGKQFQKDILIAEYKKVSEGKIQINFELFEKLIIKLDEKYLKMMGHNPINNPLPTYEARLMLNESNKLGQLKKHRHLIFGTRNKDGRQVKERADSTRYQKKLTGHSGRFSSDLQNKIKDKTSKSIQPKSSASPIIDSGRIQLKQLRKLKLPKLNWIIEQQVQPMPRAERL